jgi:hypothetical protein
MSGFPVHVHRIRLRGGWEWSVEGSLGSPQRLTLPLAVPNWTELRGFLVRRFSRPDLDPSCEELALELHRITGTQRVLLNGHELDFKPGRGQRGPIHLPLGDLPPRNVLILEIDPAAIAGMPPEEESEWGEIALVIRRRQTGGLAPERGGGEGGELSRHEGSPESGNGL